MVGAISIVGKCNPRQATQELERADLYDREEVMKTRIYTEIVDGDECVIVVIKPSCPIEMKWLSGYTDKPLDANMSLHLGEGVDGWGVYPYISMSMRPDMSKEEWMADKPRVSLKFLIDQETK